MLAISFAAARRYRAAGDRLPRRMRGADAARNQSRHLAIPRAMAGLSREQADGHVSPRVSAAESQRQRRSLEGPAESDGCAWARSEKRKASLIPQWAFCSGCSPRLAGAVRIFWRASRRAELARFAPLSTCSCLALRCSARPCLILAGGSTWRMARAGAPGPGEFRLAS